MNKRIRSMIDEIFSEMKMTAENLALRDELMANAQARYEDAIAQNKSEEAAFAEVAASIEDVSGLLSEMNRMDGEEPAPKTEEPEIELHVDPDEAKAEEESEEAQPQEGASFDMDLEKTLNRAFSALENFGKTIMPQAKKLVQDVDEATGGAITTMSEAVNRSVKEAQKAAGEAIDKMSDMNGELVFDFGKREAPKQPQGKTPQDLREEAKDIRAEAAFKEVTGDQAGAAELNAKADELETQADAMEQAEAMAAAQKDAEQEAAGETPAQDEPVVIEEHSEPLLDEDGDVNEGAFDKVVEQIQRDAKKMIDNAGRFVNDTVNKAAGGADAQPVQTGSRMFSPAGLRMIDVALDADDVRIEEAESGMIEVFWNAKNVEGEPEVVMEGHCLKIRRSNPDVFKTFFSVFSKDGGQVTVRVPRGYAADYKINTTSGDICLHEIDVDTVKAGTTSGVIELSPDAAVRAELVRAESVTGAVTVSACAAEVEVKTVSGKQFISCDAVKVDSDVVSGTVHIEGACDEWEVNSVSGEVEMICTMPPAKKITIGTVSASARVALPGEIRGFVAERSGANGNIVNEFGANRYGTCALPIHMDSMSGSLIITRLH